MKQMNKRLVGLFMVLAMVVASLAMPFNAQAASKSITLNKAKTTIYAGQTTTLKVTKVKGLTSKAVTWKSNNKKVATVNTKGKVTGVKAGTATITATSKKSSKVKATCKVTVKTPTITLNKTKATIDVAKTTTVSVKSVKGLSSKAVTYKTSDKKIATVNTKGKVTGVKAGTATITVTSKNGKATATCKVTVKRPYPTKLILNHTTYKFTKEGQKKNLDVKSVVPTGAYKASTWKSSNTNVATVNSDGVVTAKNNGTAIITSTSKKDPKVKATCKVTVAIPNVDTLSLSADETEYVFTVNSKMKSYNYVSESVNKTVAMSTVDAAWKNYQAVIAKGVTKDTVWNLINSDVVKAFGGTLKTAGNTKTVVIDKVTVVLTKSNDNNTVEINGKKNTLAITKASSTEVTGTIAGRTVRFNFTNNHFAISDSDLGTAVSISVDNGTYTAALNTAAVDRLNVKRGVDIAPTHVYSIHK